MRQLIIILLNTIAVCIAGRIDTAFANNLSVDAICVLASYNTIYFLTYSIYNIGAYGYRTIMTDSKSCLMVSAISGTLIGLVIFLTRDLIPMLFSLTTEQRELFSKCLVVLAIMAPIAAVSDFTYNYILMQCYNKLVTVTNILFYAIMLIGDSYVFFTGKDLDSLLIATLISYLIYGIVNLLCSDILKIKEQISLKSMLKCFKHGINISIDRSLGRLGGIIYSSLASKLGTESYAIHSVCLALCISVEDVTYCLYTVCLIKLKGVESNKEKWLKSLELLKQSFLLLMVVSYVITYVTLFFIHGSTPLSSCILPSILYSSGAVLGQFYESSRAYLTSIQRSDLVKYCGLVSLVTKCLVAYLGYFIGLGLWAFAISIPIDYIVKSLYTLKCSKIKERQLL